MQKGEHSPEFLRCNWPADTGESWRGKSIVHTSKKTPYNSRKDVIFAAQKTNGEKRLPYIFYLLSEDNSMKSWRNNVIAAVVLSAVLIGCSAKKAEPVAVNGLEMYKDESLAFGIKYPSNWKLRKQAGAQAVVFSEETAADRFNKYDAEGMAGAKIAITAMKADGKTLDQIVADSKEFEATVYTAPEKVTLGGAPGTKLAYSFDLADGKYQGEKYFAMKDSMYVTVVEFGAFGGTFDAYRKSFDEILASVELAVAPAPKEVKRDTVIAKSEPAPPSEPMRSITGNGFSINVPGNFSGARTTVKGTLASASYVGDRLDCTIQVDVFDASKQQNLDKIVADNKARYKASNANATTIGGAKAFSINYSFVKDVSSRVYFTIKGDKMFRITLNWFKPAESVYLPVFEKSVASFKFQ